MALCQGQWVEKSQTFLAEISRLSYRCNVTDSWNIVGGCVVRFPNSLGCELGERRACTRGIFLPWQSVAKIFIESGQLRTELACSTRELALSHWPTSHKCTECGCGAAFLPSSSLGFPHNSIFQSDFQLDFFHIFQTFVSHLFSSCMRLPPSLSFWPTFQFLSVCQYILMWRTGGPLFFRLCSQKIANACAVSHNISYSGIVTVLSTVPNS